MTPEQLGQFLDELGKRLGPAGQHVFGLAVRQAVIDGIIGVVGSVLFLTAVVVGVRWVWAHTGGSTESYSDANFARGMAAAGAVLIGGAAFINLAVSLSILLNPEYHAITSLLSSIGGK